ncbi:MAG: hypothetical protein HY961_01260 [Ignavibacteriae bacterium]|nr:hypothetical protein [Ignavibacteriota bacterium]
MQASALRRTLFVALTVAAVGIIGCSKNESDPMNPDGEGGFGNTPSTPVPQEMVGMWYAGTIGLTNFYNPGTGQWTSGRGLGMFYKLYANGTYEYGWQGQVTNYNCTTSGLVYKRGTVVVGDSVLTLHSTYGRAKGEYTCSPASNFDRPEPPSTSTIIVRRGQDEQGNPVMFIRMTTGDYVQYKLLE